MVSGFVTSPNDQPFIFSGDATASLIPSKFKTFLELISVNLAMQRTSVHFTISTKIEALIDPSQVLTNTREIFIV
jgi:hypothetical protein